MIINKTDRQYGYSEAHPDTTYNVEIREQKVKKMISVLDDYYSGGLEKLSLLDVGCSSGIITNMLSKKFCNVIGTDIDEQAVRYASESYVSENLQFIIQDAMNLGFSDQSFDVIVCAHIYEHVPDSDRLMAEIYRVLKPGGICYFAAGNRLSLIEPHYKLPLLSVIPKPLGHFYLRILKQGNYYYENHLTLRGLRNLVSQFEVIDYSLKIIKNPQKYCAIEMLQDRSLKQKVAILFLSIAYWLCPTYLWLLHKKEE